MNTSSLLRVAIVAGTCTALLGAGCGSASTAEPTESLGSTAATTTIEEPSASSTAAATSTATAPKPTTTSKTTTATKPKTTTKTQTPQNQTVVIQNSAFSPMVIAITTGATVTWINKDTTPHTTKSDGALLWDSGSIQPGKSFSHTFKSAGTYTYSCAIHPTMTGTVIVRDPIK